MTLFKALQTMGKMLRDRGEVIGYTPSGKAVNSEGFPYQTDEYFSEKHQSDGCYVQCVGKIAWDEGAFRSNNPLEEMYVNAKIAQDGEYIGRDFTVRWPEELFLVMGLVVRYTDRWESAERVTGPNERALLRMAYKDMIHFVIEGEHNVVGWDPWSAEGSLTGKRGEVLDKRVFVVIRKASDAEVKAYG